MRRVIGGALAALALAGCHDPFSNDEILFLKAAPRGLRIEVPDDGKLQQGLRAAQADEGTPARFYQDTRRTAEETNDGIFALLDLVDALVEFEPSVREEDRRIWGPLPVSAQMELALLVDRVRTATVVRYTSTSTPAEADQLFTYALLARAPGGGDDDWLPLFGGNSLPQASNRQGTGYLAVDLDNIRRFDPSSDGAGLIFVAYDTRFGETAIDLALDTVRQGPFMARAAWAYRDDGAGGGRFVYFLVEDLVDTTPAEEILGIAARWLPSGRGRADVVVTQGDVPSFYLASECWDDAFARVYLDSNIPVPDFMRFGQVSACGPELLTPQFPPD
jgi:hypothetical protein